MSEQLLTALIRDLNRSVLALATVGAALHLREAGKPPHPALSEPMSATLAAIGMPTADTVDDTEARQAYGLIRTFFHEALSLMEEPERDPGWRFEDPAILQGIGTSSASMVTRMTRLGDGRPWLAALFRDHGAFLDVGTGVGGVALAAASAWSSMRVTGIDVWPPSLALAEQNRQSSGHADQVAFRHQAVETLADQGIYSVVWVPTPFLSAACLVGALPRLHESLRPGGAIIAGLQPPPPDSLGDALARLRTLRNGGHVWDGEALVAQLSAAGFTDVEWPSGQQGMQFVIGRRPPVSATSD